MATLNDTGHRHWTSICTVSARRLSSAMVINFGKNNKLQSCEIAF
jgi:hypothetical protein